MKYCINRGVKRYADPIEVVENSCDLHMKYNPINIEIAIEAPINLE